MPLLRELDDGGILHLSLNDPVRRIAVSQATLTALGAAFAGARSDSAVRFVNQPKRTGLLRRPRPEKR